MRRIAAIAAAGVLGLTGAGFAACGDDDKEGPAEEAGKALDDAGSEAGEELDEVQKDAERELNDDKGE